MLIYKNLLFNDFFIKKPNFLMGTSPENSGDYFLPKTSSSAPPFLPFSP